MRALSILVFARATASLPCDTYAAAGTPCVGAFSLLRALRADYSGPLYYVRRATDNTTAAVPLSAPGGLVNASVQEEFCAGTSCAVWRIVDQSLYNNDLTPAPPGGSARHVDNGVNASALPVRMPDGSRAYGALFVHGANQGYRIDITNGVAVCVAALAPARPAPKKVLTSPSKPPHRSGNEAETIYMVTSGEYYNPDCCLCVARTFRARPIFAHSRPRGSLPPRAPPP